MDIGAIIGEYVYLKAIGEDFVGRCPFCLHHQRMLVVIPQLKTYECLHCGQHGGALDFIRRIESIIRWDIRRSLKWPVAKHTIGTVYVLELEGDYYYIGFTQDLVKRLGQHFDSKGAQWTKKHRPLRLIDVYYDVPALVEHRVTKRYIERFGMDKVRGGWYVDARDEAGPYQVYPSRSFWYARHKPVAKQLIVLL
jgi:hypothetical protein